MLGELFEPPASSTGEKAEDQQQPRNHQEHANEIQPEKSDVPTLEVQVKENVRANGNAKQPDQHA